MRLRPGQSGPSPKAAELGEVTLLSESLGLCFPLSRPVLCPLRDLLVSPSVSALLCPPSLRSVRNQLVLLSVQVNRAAPNPELPKLEPEQEQFSWSCEANAFGLPLFFIFPAVSCV